MNKELSPFEIVKTAALNAKDKILELQLSSQANLPSVKWNFAKLAKHLESLAELIGDGLPLKAMKEHENFSVSTPGVLLGRISTARKRAAAGLVAASGGRSTSAAKRIASRENARLARAAKGGRFDTRYRSQPNGMFLHGEIKLLRAQLSRAKWKLKWLSKQRRRDNDAPNPITRLEKRIALLLDEIRWRNVQLDTLHVERWRKTMNEDYRLGS